MSSVHSKRGFVLIATCIVVALLLGLAALGTDIGRMYVIKSELQAFADAAALNAAVQLDASDAGLARARQAATDLAGGPHAMKWDLGTQPIRNIAVSFAGGDAAPEANAWQANPAGSNGLRFVRVVASAPAPLIFVRVFQTLESSTVAASSVAVRTGQSARLIQ